MRVAQCAVPPEFKFQVTAGVFPDASGMASFSLFRLHVNSDEGHTQNEAQNGFDTQLIFHRSFKFQDYHNMEFD